MDLPSADKHLKRAHQHLGVAKHMACDPLTLSWASVVLFYAARDLAHAVFDQDRNLQAAMRHPESHTNQDLAKPGTNVVIKRHFRRIEGPYMDLYGSGLGVRYNGERITEKLWRELEEDFREVCDWAGHELTAAGRSVLPEWMTDPI